jgi:nucleotide-binding universal stress UspA family protein
MFKRILVPLDGSDLAASVLPLAKDVALRFQATLILFHVLEKDVPETIHGQRHLAHEKEACEYLGELALELISAGIPVETEVHENPASDVARSIREHARELQADLVLLCAHGRGGLRDILIGPIAQQVIQQETIPVLFVRPETGAVSQRAEWKNILVPLDGNEVHEAVLPVAMQVATAFSARIRLLTVVPVAGTLPGKESAIGRILPGSTLMALDYAADEAKEYLERVTRQLLQKGVPTSGIVLRGDPVNRIIETIENEKLDLVLVATYGHSNLDAFWEESVTPKVMGKSPVPVLFVRHARENQ